MRIFRGFVVEAVLDRSQEDLRRAVWSLRAGLLGMRERVRALSGVFTLTSSPGQGTQITISLPPTSHG